MEHNPKVIQIMRSGIKWGVIAWALIFIPGLVWSFQTARRNEEVLLIMTFSFFVGFFVGRVYVVKKGYEFSVCLESYKSLIRNYITFLTMYLLVEVTAVGFLGAVPSFKGLVLVGPIIGILAGDMIGRLLIRDTTIKS